MVCAVCGGEQIAFAIPDVVRDLLDEQPQAMRICTECLIVEPAETGAITPDFDRIIEGFPSGIGGVAMAIAVGRLVDSVALYRAELERLFTWVTDRGIDPWLVVERLDAAGSVTPASDLERSRRQFEQLFSS